MALSRANRKTDAQAIYAGASRAAYEAASDTLGQLTDQAVANAQAASERLGVAYRQAFWLIVLGIVIAGVMVVAALIHISRSISAPLLQLADRMRRLAANNTDIDIPETERRDEIGEMAQATVVFRNNAIELMRSQRTLARQAAMLEEQLAQEQRLALAQRNFVSMASHEFRTPLTIIDGHARRLEKMREGAVTAEIGERAGKIRAAVLRLTHLIDNLLSSGRLIDGGVELYFDPAGMDLAALLREVCQLHREMVPAAEIVEHFGDPPMPIVGDAKLLFQVFSNLLSNAVKYSPNGGAILVEAAMMRTKPWCPSPIAASGFRQAISTGCSSAIIAAATFQASSGPASGFISSRWRSTCTKAASRWRARKAMARASSFACRSSARRRHRQSTPNRKLRRCAINRFIG